MQNKSKIMYFLTSLVLIIPSILFYITNKTLAANTYAMEFGFEPNFINLTGETYCIIYGIIVLILGLMSFYIAKNHDKLFKDSKDVFKYIIIISGIFVLILPFTSTDIYYYFGSSRMFEHFGVSPYSSTLGDFIKNNPLSLNDEFIFQSSSNFWIDYNYPYPPIWLLITSILTRLSGGSMDICVLITKILLAAIHILNVWLIHKTFKNNMFTLIYGLNPAMLLNGITELHGEIFIIFFMILSLYFLIEKNNILLSVIALGLSASVKFIAILALPFILLYYFQKLSPDKRFIKCVIYGLVFLVIMAITIFPFMSISQLVGLLSHQQSYFANGLYSLLLKIPGLDVYLIKNIIFILFVISYITLCFYWLFKKEISKEYMLNTILIILSVFMAMVLAVFRSWYVLWAIPFSIKHPKFFFIWSVLTHVVLLLSQNISAAYSLLYLLSIIGVLVIIILMKTLFKKNNKKYELI